ncbi:MAG: transglycosylase SLT domain-containing protein [Pseudomonadota bacterium]|nr:transglycosylase SLT domain-containing protein [Pseudomonadota bacterium]
MIRSEPLPGRGRLRRVFLLLCVCALLATADLSVAEERQDFIAAEAALERDDALTFVRLAERLRDYPLYPYLHYRQLARNLDQATDRGVERFLEDYRDTPLARRLRRAWLERLAKQQRWQDYVRFYEPDSSTERLCNYLHGLILTGNRDEALGQVEPLWLTGRSQPDACDPVFDAWEQDGRLTADLVWKRIGLAMAANQLGLARYLRRSLPDADRIWVDRWLAVHKNPSLILDPGTLSRHHTQEKRILAHGVRRLARGSAQQAADAWNRLRGSYDFPPDLAEDASASVGFALAEDGDARGLPYLADIRATKDNIELQERRLRIALEQRDWDRVAAWVDAMPDGQRKSEHWLYWQARALEKQGKPERARGLYEEAARERSLWGFLAAERAGQPYTLGNSPTPAADIRVRHIEDGPASRRIAELQALGRDLEVRREWHHLTQKMGAEDLKAAAVVAQQWGWPAQAIFTLAKSDYWDDLALRFPLLHRETVRTRAQATGLDQSWIYAVIRQESAFDRSASSHAGAAGLMQLMPATARGVARSLGLGRPSREDLYDPQLNITLGSSYLAEMGQRYGGNPVLATAAYNAGPGNVDEWLPSQQLEADIWIATIPFRETRSYVRRVLTYRLIYDNRLGKPISPLGGLLRPIGRGAVLSGGGLHGGATDG